VVELAFKIRPIKPKSNRANFKAVEAAVKRAMERAADEATELLEEATRTWDNQPEFEQVWLKDGVVIGTDDEVFQFVDEGTKPHIIEPKRPGGLLRFRTGYIAKTLPNHLGSWGGGANGSVVIRRSVRHPGTKPRNFIKLVDKEMRKRVPELIQEELDKTLR